MQSLLCENEFYLHVNENSFSYERLCTKTRFEKRSRQLGNGLLLAAFLYQLVLKQEQMYIFYYLVFSLSAFSQKSDQYIYLSVNGLNPGVIS